MASCQIDWDQVASGCTEMQPMLRFLLGEAPRPVGSLTPSGCLSVSHLFFDVVSSTVEQKLQNNPDQLETTRETQTIRQPRVWYLFALASASLTPPPELSSTAQLSQLRVTCTGSPRLQIKVTLPAESNLAWRRHWPGRLPSARAPAQSRTSARLQGRLLDSNGTTGSCRPRPLRPFACH